MDSEYLNIKIRNIPPIKGSCEKSIKYLNSWRTEVAKQLLQTCAQCDKFMDCSLVVCPTIVDTVNSYTRPPSKNLNLSRD